MHSAVRYYLKKMLLILLIALGTVSIQARRQLDDEGVDLVVHYRESCSKNSNVDPALLERAHRGEFSDNPDFKKYVSCVAQEIGFIDDSGSVVKTKVSGIFKDYTDEILNACLSTSRDPIERAVATIKCLYEEDGFMLL